ncbi:MAG: hypothetical protein ACYCPT_01970 [Acidimicrobiales bacterium]
MKGLIALAAVAGVAYLVVKAAPKSTPAAAASVALDVGMDTTTALLVQQALQTTVDPVALRALAASVNAKGYVKSAAALNLKATTLCVVNQATCTAGVS